jgi:hypothetical protein
MHSKISPKFEKNESTLCNKNKNAGSGKTEIGALDDPDFCVKQI